MSYSQDSVDFIINPFNEKVVSAAIPDASASCPMLFSNSNAYSFLALSDATPALALSPCVLQCLLGSILANPNANNITFANSKLSQHFHAHSPWLRYIEDNIGYTATLAAPFSLDDFSFRYVGLALRIECVQTTANETGWFEAVRVDTKRFMDHCVRIDQGSFHDHDGSPTVVSVPGVAFDDNRPQKFESFHRFLDESFRDNPSYVQDSIENLSKYTFSLHPHRKPEFIKPDRVIETAGSASFTENPVINPFEKCFDLSFDTILIRFGGVKFNSVNDIHCRYRGCIETRSSDVKLTRGFHTHVSDLPNFWRAVSILNSKISAGYKHKVQDAST